MATYKKRGYKPKNKAEEVEQLEDNSTTAEVFNTLDEGASRTEEWVAANQKYIFIIVGAIAAVVLGYLGYQKYIQEPKELEASNEMFKAQQYFDNAVNGNTTISDSLYTLALNGGEGKYGFLEIIENYGGTKAANLSNYYAGFSYLNMKKYQEAIDYLDKFKSDDEMLGPLALGGIGDAFAQLDQMGEALSYYERAAKAKNNEFTTPKFLLKSAITAISLGKPEIAVTYLERIKEEFSKSAEANQADVHLGRAQGMLK
ncbi:Tetratricopeptide repeat-containing protein [Aquimarina amphilecti]|uniref:Tetratricopeptide repeat-containing protein n=1 Tax=Aquimarina amphilecti TaxID=1038014 RepID=A0A1H7TMN6_AQUAM|nr:tetratricopeptide repeat protein [Aquimarina amphilecti]SEL85835.1 Tetratricopeptide repeat-containing protein [Aquimarina amphilecti]